MKKYLALLLLFVCSSVTCQTRQRERSFVIVKAVQQRTVKVEDPFLLFEYPSLRTKYHVEKVLQGSYSGEYFYDYSDKTRRHTVYNYCLMSIEHIGDSVCGLDSQHCYDVYSGNGGQWYVGYSQALEKDFNMGIRSYSSLRIQIDVPRKYQMNTRPLEKYMWYREDVQGGSYISHNGKTVPKYGVNLYIVALDLISWHNKHTSNQEEPHEYVDLGLSVKWATCNVGAYKPEDSGDFYAWGETVPKSYYSEFSYQWCDSVLYNSLNKYNGIEKCGKVDHLETLEPADDVAHVKWGGQWRMPTKAEFDELIENCTWTWTTINNVNGYRITSKKEGFTDRSIFLPAPGGFSYSNINLYNSYGGYHSSSLNTEYPGFNYYLGFGSGNQYVSSDYRFAGSTVRPVCP